MDQPVFENNQIEHAQLPSIGELNFQNLDPAFLRLSYVRNVLFYATLLIIIVYLLSRPEIAQIKGMPYVLIGLWGFLTLLGLILIPKLYAAQGYALREKDINYKKGLLYKSMTAIPFNRVQHCEIKQGPIERVFDLKTLEIFTAGGQSSDLAIPGLKPEIAQKIKEYIINRTTQDGAPE